MNQKYTLTAAYYLAFILLGLSLGAEGPTLPKLAENTASTLDQISLIFFSGSLGYLLGSYISGRIYDRLPGHQFMAGVIVLLGIAIAFVPIAPSLGILLVITLIAGFAKGAIDVGGNTLILWVHQEKVDPFMNGLHAFFGLGAFIGPRIVAQALTVTDNIYWVYWTLAIAAFPIAVLVWSLPSPSPRAMPEEHKAAPLPVLPLAIMVLCFVLYVGAEVGYGAWIYTYALQLGLGTEITSADLTSAFWGAFTLGRLIGIPVSKRLRPISILYIDFAGCLLSLGLILLFRDSVAILWIGSILLGLSFASIFPTFLTLSEERMHVTGTMAGWFLVGGSIGGMILPWGIGQAFVRIGPSAMITIVFITVVFNLLTLILFIKTPLTASQKGLFTTKSAEEVE
jgi:FHS family Na+ dependent glucose MFS transporter 1